jgi:general secretion pathway protein J
MRAVGIEATRGPPSSTLPRGAGEGRGGSPRGGFTLFEAVIAIAIMAIMGALIWGSFGPSFALKEEVEKQGERNEQIRGAMLRMAHEISMAFLSNDYDKGRYREMLTLFDGRHGAGGRDTLTFTSLTHTRLFENALESDQVIVGYRVQESKTVSGQYDLLRREKTVIDDQWDRGGDEEILCEDVQGLTLRYWDDTKKDWVEDWNTKDVERANTLPFRVELTLLVGPWGTTPERFVTQTQIFLPQPLDRTQ